MTTQPLDLDAIQRRRDVCLSTAGLAATNFVHYDGRDLLTEVRRLRNLLAETTKPAVSGTLPAADHFAVIVVPDTGVTIAGPIPEPILLVPQPRPHLLAREDPK